MSEYIIESKYDTLNGMFSRIKHEEIVRCRDCMNVDVEDYGAWGHVWRCEGIGEVEPDGFCAWGERRDDGNDR